MRARGFRYVLEPVRQVRRWAVDGLVAELAAAHAALAAEQGEYERLAALERAARAEWNALGAAGQAMRAEQLALAARYLGDCRRRQQAQADAVLAAEQALAAVQQQVQAARCELDAVEEHRLQAQRDFRRQRQDGEIKAADELWNVLKAGR